MLYCSSLYLLLPSLYLLLPALYIVLSLSLSLIAIPLSLVIFSFCSVVPSSISSCLFLHLFFPILSSPVTPFFISCYISISYCPSLHLWLQLPSFLVPLLSFPVVSYPSPIALLFISCSVCLHLSLACYILPSLPSYTVLRIFSLIIFSSVHFHISPPLISSLGAPPVTFCCPSLHILLPA